MLPSFGRLQIDDEFSDYEVLGDGLCSNAVTKSSLLPAITVNTPKDSIIIDNQKTPLSSTHVNKFDDAVSHLTTQVKNDAHAVNEDLANIRIGIVTLDDQISESGAAHSRRIRSLEFQHDEYEHQVRECASGVLTLRRTVGEISTVGLISDISKLRHASEEAMLRSINTASRVDILLDCRVAKFESNVKHLQKLVVPKRKATVNDRWSEFQVLKTQVGALSESDLSTVFRAAEQLDQQTALIQSHLCSIMGTRLPDIECTLRNVASVTSKSGKMSASLIAKLSRNIDAHIRSDAAFHNMVSNEVEILEERGTSFVKEAAETRKRITRCEIMTQQLVGTLLPRLTTRIYQNDEKIQNRANDFALKESELQARIIQLESQTAQADGLDQDNERLRERIEKIEGNVSVLLMKLGLAAGGLVSEVASVEFLPALSKSPSETTLVERFDNVLNALPKDFGVPPPPPGLPSLANTLTVYCETIAGPTFTLRIPKILPIWSLKEWIYVKSNRVAELHPTSQRLMGNGAVLLNEGKVGDLLIDGGHIWILQQFGKN